MTLRAKKPESSPRTHSARRELTPSSYRLTSTHTDDIPEPVCAHKFIASPPQNNIQIKV